MKKWLVMLAVCILSVATASARDYITRDTSELPTQARTLLSSTFKNAKVNHIKVDTGAFGSKEFDVVLDNGTEVEFNKAGEWKEVNAGMNGVPASLYPKAIDDYVNANYSGMVITHIEKDHRKLKIELSNGLDIEFDTSGRFLRFDD